jgi:hypothetical protein
VISPLSSLSPDVIAPCIRQWKLLVGAVAQSGWQGPVFPNASTNWMGSEAIVQCTYISTYNSTYISTYNSTYNSTTGGLAAGNSGTNGVRTTSKAKLACLYELNSDPNEIHDVADDHPQVVDQVLFTYPLQLFTLHPHPHLLSRPMGMWSLLLCQLLQRRSALEATALRVTRGTDTGEACKAAFARGQYWGPFLPPPGSGSTSSNGER